MIQVEIILKTASTMVAPPELKIVQSAPGQKRKWQQVDAEADASVGPCTAVAVAAGFFGCLFFCFHLLFRNRYLYRRIILHIVVPFREEAFGKLRSVVRDTDTWAVVKSAKPLAWKQNSIL